MSSRFFRILPLFTILLLVFSCKKKAPTSEIDNLFKFKEYISSHTHDELSIASPISILLAQPLEQYEFTQELPSEYLNVSPKVKGKLAIENGRELVFQPSEYLKPDTEYVVTLALNKLFKGIDSEYKEFTFGFKTITPNFKINLDDLQSYSKNWQYLSGTLEASDILDAKKISEVLSVKQGDKKIPVKWNNTAESAQYYSFIIDSIPREIDDSKLTIRWNGKDLSVDNQGEENYTIPGLNKFVVVDAKTTSSPNAVLTLNFSEPLKKGQNLKGLVTIENAQNLRYEMDGNVLKVYPSTRIFGKVQVTVHEGIKSEYGFSLKKEFSEQVSFEQLKPAVRLISKGVILPNATSTPIYFETVNLSAVEVNVTQIYENNILQYLQVNDLNPEYNNEIGRVGKKVAHKVISLAENGETNTSYWKAHALNLSELFKVSPGAIYHVDFSFEKEHTSYQCEDEEDTENNYSYWQNRDNPCHEGYYYYLDDVSTNLLGSDLGLIVKKGNNQSYHFATTNLVTTNPEANAVIKLYDYQQQSLGEITTDASGFGIFDGEETPASVIAEKNNHFAYAKLEDGQALSLSKFDVSGQTLQSGLQGFMYTERGVHRPGDTVHLTFVLDDKNNPIPDDHPVTLEVTDARGKLVQRNILKEQPVQVEGPLYAKKEKNFYYFPIPTKPEAPTGSWSAKIIVGGAEYYKNINIASIKPNRLKMDIAFDDEILKANEANSGKLNVKWLHGAPARNLKVDINAKIQNDYSSFPNFKGYQFRDPVRSFSSVEEQFIESKLDENGVLSINEKINVNGNAPGMLRAVFTTKVFEKGGDFSIDVFSRKLAPFSHFVGLRSPKARKYGSYWTDENTLFDVVSINADGKASGNRKLKVQIFKIEWRWWWNRGSDNLSRYENATVHRPYKEMTVTTASNGKSSFNINIPDDDGGRFLIRVIDKASGHSTGRIAYFYKNWWKRPASGDSESSKILLFSADKEKYELGEEAVITFPSDRGGRALLSIENGSEVLSQQWIETSAKETTAKIPITAEMTPNAYINISLLQPHGQVANDLPIRLYGVIPILVENPATHLNPKLQMPDVIRPETSFDVKVSETNDKPMTYSLAIVDEGLLDLTRFKTPDIHGSFYTRQALGVRTFDIFDDVMGAYSISVDNIYEIGGGKEIADGSKNRKAQRFKPVVSYLGPFTLKAGEKGSHTIDMPNYIGSVRAMLVAGNENSAYGNTEETIPVRKPLMVLTSLPRKLSPGEKVTIPITVFAMEKKVKNVKVSIDAGKALEPIGTTSKNITFNAIGEQIVNFDFKVNPAASFQTIKVKASTAGESASSETEIDVENPNPITSKSTLHTINGNQNQTVVMEPFGTSGTNSATIEFSTLPPMDFSNRLNYLIRYPHGCVEQTTSSVFSQLFLDDVLDITFEKKKKAEKNIKTAIKRLNTFQTPSGGLSYWPAGREPNAWGTTYAGHFMLEAKQKGYQLPLTFLSSWLRYQKNAARTWRIASTYNDDITQAYRLYTLALAQQPELAAMNRLRESKDLSNEAKWRLAAAYALVGKKGVAKELMQIANIDFQPNRYNYRTYGSVFRNRAMALETLVILEDGRQRDLAISLAKKLSSQNWYSTQETSYALLAMGKMVRKNGGKSINLTFTNNGKEITIKTDRTIAQRDLIISSANEEIQVKNKDNNIIYATLVESGKLPLGQELEQEKNLQLSVSYLDAAGNKIDVSQLQQGTELKAEIRIYNSSSDYIDNLALAQIVPSGWEIVNTSYAETSDPNRSKSDYIDVRDDRTHIYFDLGPRKSKTFYIKLNASFLGDYYLPGTQVEAMYNDNYYARNKGQWIKVVQ